MLRGVAGTHCLLLELLTAARLTRVVRPRVWLLITADDTCGVFRLLAKLHHTVDNRLLLSDLAVGCLDYFGSLACVTGVIFRRV